MKDLPVCKGIKVSVAVEEAKPAIGGSKSRRLASAKSLSFDDAPDYPFAEIYSS